MLNIQTQVKTALSTVLTTYLEQFKSSAAALPCISILQISNNVDGNHQGDNLAWSRIYYEVKLYADDYADIATYTPQIDTAMRGLGFIRRSGKDFTANGMVCSDLTYELLTMEHFN